MNYFGDRIADVGSLGLPDLGISNLDDVLTDVRRGIFNVVETIPVTGGQTLTLLYPQWLPGNHAPRTARPGSTP